MGYCRLTSQVHMAGIYLHIPFCRQACYYCNFHFSTRLEYKERVVRAIAKELFLRREELQGETVKTVYFGGGTPSLLNERELEVLWEALFTFPGVDSAVEVTLESNPDDMDEAFFERVKNFPFNRLSIGIQSFDPRDLNYLNRTHTAEQAKLAVYKARENDFKNVSIDLIYGIPGETPNRWEHNLEYALGLEVPHLSAYCLTIEPATVFGRWEKKGKFHQVLDEEAERQFFLLSDFFTRSGYEHYEISNLALPNFYSQHNRSYWQGIPYLGVGPGAHSWKNGKRSWNKGNNLSYMRSIEDGKLPSESEMLTLENRINECIMTGLRTQWGVDLQAFERDFGPEQTHTLKNRALQYIRNNRILVINQNLILHSKSRFLADGIASDLFLGRTS